MPYEDNSNSFLFGLNQFTSPPADASTPRSNTRSDNMLAQLEAFASDDVAGMGLNEGGTAQAPNFADQLALWTNANFSFDGPTGHALLGDEDKEKEEAEHNRKREDETRRNQQEERERNSRNAAASSRASNALRGKARDIGPAQPEVADSFPTTSQAPIAPQTQQQAPYYPGTFTTAAPRPPQPSVNALYQAFGAGQVGNAQQQGLANAAGNLGTLDMTSTLALQHLLTSNPLALASLSHLAGLSHPQLQTHLAGLANNGAGFGLPFGQQPQQQQPQIQQQNQTRNDATAAAAAAQWQSQDSSRAGSISGASAQSAASWLPQMQNLQATQSTAGPAPSFAHGATGRHAGSSQQGAHEESGSGTRSVEMAASDSDSGAATKKKRTSTSEGKKPQVHDDEDGLDDIERRYEIPPLSLIDTGNPEADAEANRQAIEEDKRRRNTAASARFRIKKKQREAALETAAKELHQRLADLESENARLRTENGWLKSLITVRPDQAMPGGLDQSAVPNPFSNAAAAIAARASTSARPSGSNSAIQTSSNHATPDSTTTIPQQEIPDRHTGLHPRGVGTTKPDPEKPAHGKRDRDS